MHVTYLNIIMQQNPVKRRLKNTEKAKILEIGEKMLETDQWNY